MNITPCHMCIGLCTSLHLVTGEFRLVIHPTQPHNHMYNTHTHNHTQPHSLLIMTYVQLCNHQFSYHTLQLRLNPWPHQGKITHSQRFKRFYENVENNSNHTHVHSYLRECIYWLEGSFFTVCALKTKTTTRSVWRSSSQQSTHIFHYRNMVWIIMSYYVMVEYVLPCVFQLLDDVWV